ncbi:MAG: MurR/RpiR family transcriptional regulator [Eubacterium sp.]|nr:MurR/RpiR family transcriptional regulator [Eubacterium sp.]
MKNTNDIISKINSKYAYMSKGQKLLSSYITDNIEHAAFLTASKLGEEVGVSESTVVRFAGFLGYKGYPEFQKAVEDVLKSRLYNNDKDKVNYGNVKKSKVLRSVLSSDAQRIQETLELSDEDTFNAAVDMIAGARTIYIIGLRYCSPLAEILAMNLRLMVSDVRVLNSTNASELFERLLYVSSRDVVIGISFPRYSMRTLKALEFASSRNAKIITLTDSYHSPVNLYSSCNLLAVTDMSTIIESMVAPLSIINALTMRLTMKKQKEVSLALEALDNLWEEYDVAGNDDIEFLDDKIKFRFMNESRKEEEDGE